MKAFGIEVKTLFNTPRTSAQEKYVARIEARAKALFFEGGYSRRNDDSVDSCEVVTPNSWHYLVKYPDPFEEKGGSCNCEGFIADGECKHRIAVVLMRELEREADRHNCTDIADYLLMLEAERQAEETRNAENPETGCDTFAF